MEYPSPEEIFETSLHSHKTEDRIINNTAATEPILHINTTRFFGFKDFSINRRKSLTPISNISEFACPPAERFHIFLSFSKYSRFLISSTHFEKYRISSESARFSSTRTINSSILIFLSSIFSCFYTLKTAEENFTPNEKKKKIK